MSYNHTKLNAKINEVGAVLRIVKMSYFHINLNAKITEVGAV